MHTTLVTARIDLSSNFGSNPFPLCRKIWGTHAKYNLEQPLVVYISWWFYRCRGEHLFGHKFGKCIRLALLFSLSCCWDRFDLLTDVSFAFTVFFSTLFDFGCYCTVTSTFVSACTVSFRSLPPPHHYRCRRCHLELPTFPLLYSCVPSCVPYYGIVLYVYEIPNLTLTSAKPQT